MLEKFETYLEDTRLAREARNPALLRQMRDSALPIGRLGGNGFRGYATDAAVAGGQVFLQSELEKHDPKIREPLTSVTWMRDMTVLSGGGWVDFTNAFSVDYGISGPNGLGIVAGETTSIPIIQANVSKAIYPVFNWENVLKVSYIDLQKMQNVGRSLEDMLDKGIKLNWNKTLDQFVYQGPFTGQTGLLNNVSVPVTALPNGASGFSTWAKKTQLEILADVNSAMVATWAASNYDVTGMANHILIPPNQYTIIAAQPVNLAGAVSTLTFLQNNNIGKTQGVDLQIYPSRWCIGAGAGATDRMLAYVNDKDRVHMDVTVPIHRAMTNPTVAEGGAYLTLYAGQIGIVKILALQAIGYFDGL